MAAGKRPAFDLSKWYVDAVGESGDVFIGYRARLRWRRLKVSYAATLTGGDAREPRTRSAVREGREPDFFQGALSWESPRLGVAGTWRDASQPSVVRTLHESEEGAVLWRCLMPRAKAEIALEGSRVVGLGYAEHLSLTIPPWRLPIDALRWGRFLTPTHSVVWIEWLRGGSPPRTWIFVDGGEVRGDVSEEAVSFEGGRVELPARGRLVLRSGRLSSLLRNLPVSLRTSAPGRALALHETKWRTRGCLALSGAPPEGGWALHETVRFA